MRKHKFWMLLLTVCLFLTVIGALWLTAPWDRGVKPDILFDGGIRYTRLTGRRSASLKQSRQYIEGGSYCVAGGYGGKTAV